MIKSLKNIKSFVIGFLCCALLSATVAYAEESSQIEVYFNNIKFMFDGVEKKPIVNDGFIYNGSTYVPLRFVSEALGKDVLWDGDNNTIWVGRKEGNSVLLNSLAYARLDGVAQQDGLSFNRWNGNDDYKHLYGSEFSIADETYSHGLGLYIGKYLDNWGSIDYNLNGNYKRMYGYIGIDDFTKNSNSSGIVRVFGDGKEIYTSPKIKGGDLPLEMDANLTGVLKLRIKFESNQKDELNIDFAEIHLVQ
ncbi:MAG: hypothetical protein JWM44_1613 [Bacilli bacterium]|nr:hypothetical protein [Bacilli bacterium]